MKNKNVLKVIGAIIVILIIVVLSVSLSRNESENGEELDETAGEKTTAVFEKVSNAEEYTFTKTLDDNNKETIIVKGDKAYKEVVSDGKMTKYIIKDGDTYFLDEENKVYYMYQNNDLVITEIEQELEVLGETSATTGKEKIEGKTYSYEEFDQNQRFLINNDIAVTDLNRAKTRLYYNAFGNLVYIKTIAGNNEEILKVSISYGNVDDKKFEFPEDYKNGDR